MTPEVISAGGTISGVPEVSELSTSDDNGHPSIRYKPPEATYAFSVPIETFRAPLWETTKKVYALAASANIHSVARAGSTVAQLYEDAAETESWFAPLASVDEDGDVALEWWRDDRKLTLYISPNTVEYIQVERPAVSSDLVDGIIETPEDRRKLWRWLTSQS
jgi:hypothetical protein